MRCPASIAAAAAGHSRIGKLMLSALRYKMRAKAAAVTQADLRCWSGLPKKVFAMRVNRPADGRIVISGGGAPVAEATLPEGNSLVFVRKPSAQAPAVVKVLSVR